MLQLIVLAAVVYFVYKWLLRERRPRPNAAPAPPPPSAAGRVEEMVQDPVCATWVPRSQALSMQHGKETIHFCSADCRDKYLEETSK